MGVPLVPLVGKRVSLWWSQSPLVWFGGAPLVWRKRVSLWCVLLWCVLRKRVSLWCAFGVEKAIALRYRAYLILAAQFDVRTIRS